jgi:phosphoribosylformylglycinamidine cyclo-ligase
MPEALAARLDPTRWPMPSVMRLFGALGGMDDEELRATFNGGLGMVVVLPPAAVAAATEAFESHGIPAAIVGEVVDAAGFDGTRYVEGALEGAV